MMRVSLKVWALTFVLVSLFLVISEPTAAQTIIHVPGDVPTIQGAINQAQNGDTVLVAPGTYSENINFDGKSITVTSDSSNGGSASNTIINGSEGPTVTFQSNETQSPISRRAVKRHLDKALQFQALRQPSPATQLCTTMVAVLESPTAQAPQYAETTSAGTS
jgi:hypothetical protein